jgi:hypothetical protein
MLGMKLSRWCAVVSTLLVTVVPCSSLTTQRRTVPNELPRSWSLDEIAKEAPPYRAEGRVYVLAWKVVEDDRPLRIESCLVLKVLDGESDTGRWCLAHLYRHPADAKPEWKLSFTHVSGKRGTKYFPGLDLLHVKRFKEKPGNKEVYGALGFEEVNWTFELAKRWKVIGCGICERSWKDAVGEKPTRFFGR